MSTSQKSFNPATEPVQMASRLVLKSDQPIENTLDSTVMNDTAHIESVVTGLGITDVEEPEITPIRTRSPPVTPLRPSDIPFIYNGDDSELERGRMQAAKPVPSFSAKAAKRRRKKQNQQTPGTASPAMNTIVGFTPGESGAEDSDAGSISSTVLSPMPRISVLAGASPGLRPSSPGVSSLKLQLDALNLGSAAGSRSASRTRSKLGSYTPSSADSTVSGEDDSTGDMVSYEIPIDQDYVNLSVNDSQNLLATSASTLCADQRATSMIARKMTADDFHTLKCLGKGTYGTVHLVKQKATGRLFAQKQFRKASLTVHKKLVEQTRTERSILESVNRHPFIVNLYYAFQDCEKLYLILEYAQGGELFHHLAMEKTFSEDVTAFYMAEMILALDHLHNTVGIIYRDLKPENCMLDSEGHLLLTDFGLSKVGVEDSGTPGGSRCNSTGIGTIEYMAPEVIKGSDISSIGPGYGKACDWWSLGALGHDLLTGAPPFGGNNVTKMQHNIMYSKLKLVYYLSPDAKDLLNRLLRKEPSKRLGVKGRSDIAIMKKHRFFRKLDWAKLERRELEPPIRPLITNPELAENFDKQFTDLSFSPVEERSKGPLSSTDPFGGFSYVASNSLLEAGYLTENDDLGI